MFDVMKEARLRDVRASFLVLPVNCIGYIEGSSLFDKYRVKHLGRLVSAKQSDPLGEMYKFWCGKRLCKQGDYAMVTVKEPGKDAFINRYLLLATRVDACDTPDIKEIVGGLKKLVCRIDEDPDSWLSIAKRREGEPHFLIPPLECNKNENKIDELQSLLSEVFAGSNSYAMFVRVLLE